jgi:hypothetical protein
LIPAVIGCRLKHSVILRCAGQQCLHSSCLFYLYNFSNCTIILDGAVGLLSLSLNRTASLLVYSWPSEFCHSLPSIPSSRLYTHRHGIICLVRPIQCCKAPTNGFLSQLRVCGISGQPMRIFLSYRCWSICPRIYTSYRIETSMLRCGTISPMHRLSVFVHTKIMMKFRIHESLRLSVLRLSRISSLAGTAMVQILNAGLTSQCSLNEHSIFCI